MSARRLGLTGLLLGAALSGCGARPNAPTQTAAAAEPTTSSQLCADYLTASTGTRCIRPLSAEEQRHRAVSFRLEREGGRVRRLLRLNGRGFPEADGDGCVEYRYRFDGAELSEVIGYQQDGVVCDHTLYSDHARRAALVDAWGRPNFSIDRLHTLVRFERDQQGFVATMRPLASDGTPTTLLSASELRYERDAQGQAKRQCYFDAQGKPMKNDYGVHCWSYELDEFGNQAKQRAWDEQGRATTSSDGGHSIVRQYDRYGNLQRQTVLGLDDKPVSVQLSWCPVLAFHRDAYGFIVGKDCLDGAGRPNHYDEGNAMWRASPDERGQPREYRYFDGQGNPFEPSFGYARIELDHDRFGHVTERRYFRVDGRPGQDEGAPVVRYVWSAQQLEVKRGNFSSRGEPWTYRGCAATDYEYDNYRQVVRATCRGRSGEVALSNENVGVTQSRYDARGSLVETSFLDVAGKPTDARRGFARELYNYDARGVDSHARHFKADGSEVTLPRFSVLWVKPPGADGFWPAPSRALALAAIERAQRELAAGTRWAAALRTLGDDKVHDANPGDAGYLNFETIYPAARAVLEPLSVGQYSAVVELPHGLALYRRTE